MNDQERCELTTYSWMESRIPAIDAFTAFVPEGIEPAPEILKAERHAGRSRWYPVPGGHRVMIPREADSPDSAHFTIEPGAWDHEHCDCCGERIQAMTLCHVTEPEQSYILLCAGCFERHVALKQQK